MATIYRLAAPLLRSFNICSLRGFTGVLEEGSLLCPVRSLHFFFGVFEVCGVSCVFPFCFSSFAFSSDFKERCVVFSDEVISGAGAVLGDVVTPLRAHGIRGATTFTVMQNWSVSKVLMAASWRLNSVFGFFFLT